MMRSLYRNYGAKLAGTLAVVLGGAIGFGTPAAQAQEFFSNRGIQFEVDTIVEFEFVESHGAYQSTFGVINLDTGRKTPLISEIRPADRVQSVERPSDYEDNFASGKANDFLGTPGNAVPDPFAEFEFQANTRYAFYLESSYNNRPAGTLYSVDTQNPGGGQRVMFEGGLASLGSGGVLLRWDDTGSVLVRQEQQDLDFDDFIIRGGGHLDCPYPDDDEVSGQAAAHPAC